ncbi:hypothetical protein SAY87_005240 [Trapa incisa]|uniref:RecQ mediated genome instability protein 1 OB-fold domain-containing protein n=1 Tax=Trapa incisa TaxID=236973 RepID=A0AAN7K635_9MYRT|nr:hypothetical protein SAY87_005240 [Trapa incisa]
MAETSAAGASPSSYSASSDAVVEALVRRGWSFPDREHINATIAVKSILFDDTGDARSIADAVESDLLNMDLRSIGAKSLPEPAVLRKSTHLLGPKVLQISSVKDISKSSIDDILKNSNRRLLRLTLTDGHNEITAIEFTHIPSIPSDVVPGTKVRLEKRAAVHAGIVCLNPQVLTVLGGVVQSLHEEWQMTKKYSALSRESLQLQHSGTGGPPPFEKLEVNAQSTWAAQREKSVFPSKSYRLDDRESEEKLRNQSVVRWGNPEPKPDGVDRSLKTTYVAGKAEDKPGTSEVRRIEVVESVPIQNQAAARKLLQKMNNPNQEHQRHGVRKGRGKGRQEEAQVFTLDEWEKRKEDKKPSRGEFPDMISDEDLAWQLQNQFDLEDGDYVQGKGPHETEAERLKRMIFSYEKESEDHQGFGRGRWGRGRGRGRGKWRGRGGRYN